MVVIQVSQTEKENLSTELKAKHDWLSYHFVQQHVQWKNVEPNHIKGTVDPEEMGTNQRDTESH